MEHLKTYIQRRASERISTNIEIRFYFGNIFYSGLVTNLSRKGMFIRTMINMPPGLMLPIIIRKDREVLIEFARVKHCTRTSHDTGGFGVELINPSRIYSEYANGDLSK